MDPAAGSSKDLVIYYQYRGVPQVFTTREFGAVSHTILIEHADSTTRRRPVPNDSGVVVIHAYYGAGRTVQDVTTGASQIFRRRGDAMVVSDTLFVARATMGYKHLMLTYSYNGIRTTWTAPAGTRVSYDALVAYAESGGQAKRESNDAPVWVTDAQPYTAVAPGATGVGAGRSSRREQGITELLKAVVELEAISGRDRSASIVTSLASTKNALAEAQTNIGYVYPPENSPRVRAQGASTADRVGNALRSLTTALDQLSDANPGRGRAAAGSMARCIAEINAALKALR